MKVQITVESNGDVFVKVGDRKPVYICDQESFYTSCDHYLGYIAEVITEEMAASLADKLLKMFS